MNQWNNEQTLTHYQGSLWVSNRLLEENRGNVCVKINDRFHVLGYVEPSMLENQPLEQVIRKMALSQGVLTYMEV